MQVRSETTRSHILQAALQLFSKFGYEATGVAEICEAAHVSKGAFYHHFPSKQAVFLALLNDWLSSLKSQLSNIRLESSSTPQAFMEMSSMASSIFQDARGNLPMFIEFWIQAYRDPSIWQQTVEPYRQYEAYFETMIRHGIQEGSLKDVDPQAAARSVMALAIGMLLQSLMDPKAAQWSEMMQQGMQLLLQCISKEGK